LVQNIAVIVQTTGYLEKLSFCPNSALRMKILSSEYQLGLGKTSMRALILNKNPNFSRQPTIKNLSNLSYQPNLHILNECC